MGESELKRVVGAFLERRGGPETFPSAAVLSSVEVLLLLSREDVEDTSEEALRVRSSRPDTEGTRVEGGGKEGLGLRGRAVRMQEYFESLGVYG